MPHLLQRVRLIFISFRRRFSIADLLWVPSVAPAAPATLSFGAKPAATRESLAVDRSPRTFTSVMLTPDVFVSSSSAASAPLASAAPALSFGKPAAPADASKTALTTTTTAAPSALTFGAPATGASATAAVPAATATPATAASAPVPSMLRGKTLEEIANSWSAELEERTRDFSDVATEVREWDRVLRENGEAVRAIPVRMLRAVLRELTTDLFEQISELYKSVLPLSPLQGQISSSLDYVENQQKDLAAILDSYEAQVGELVDQSSTSAGWRGNSGQAEKEREKAYVVRF